MRFQMVKENMDNVNIYNLKYDSVSCLADLTSFCIRFAALLCTIYKKELNNVALN